MGHAESLTRITHSLEYVRPAVYRKPGKRKAVEQIVVGMADCRIGDAPGQVLATYALGSCIGLAVHDAAAGVGGCCISCCPIRPSTAAAAAKTRGCSPTPVFR